MDYQAQAQSFLDRFGITFQAKRVGSKCPPWSGKGTCNHVHGDLHTITLAKKDFGPTISFSWWNSKADKDAGKEPRAYDVLAGLSSDYNCPETFEDFCSEFGYDTDSRSAEATFERCRDLSLRLRAFFTEAEAQALQEVQ